MTLKVNEIFYSLQGEGSRQGEPSIFIRLTGCDLTCGFCDTEFESGAEMTVESILEYLKKMPCKWIVWTGGEPALQITDEIIDYFHQAGYSQAIETNGNKKVSIKLDLITLSPKVAEHVIASNFKMFTSEYLDSRNTSVCDSDDDLPEIELKYVRHKGQMSLPVPAIRADYYFISPMFDGLNLNVENLKHCVSLIEDHADENIVWRLSIQLHKLLRIL